MCGYHCLSKDDLLEHIIVKVHKHESNFLVYCQEDGCGESFTKWDTFKKHLTRKHSNKVCRMFVFYTLFHINYHADTSNSTT